jgi:hypothetical protein
MSAAPSSDFPTCTRGAFSAMKPATTTVSGAFLRTGKAPTVSIPFPPSRHRNHPWMYQKNLSRHLSSVSFFSDKTFFYTMKVNPVLKRKENNKPFINSDF